MLPATSRISRCLAVGSAVTLAAGCLDLSPGGRVFACPECPAPDAGAPDAGAADAGTPDAGLKGCECALPPAFCEGATRVEAQAARCTASGGCAYSGVATVCPDGCEGGVCKGDACLGVVCRAPPNPMCVDSQTLRVFAGTGSCANGGCAYLSSEISCSCANNRCEANLCAGVNCQQPPPTQCNGAGLRTFGLQGTCNGQDGTCVYPPIELTCAKGCLDGQCLQDKCAGVECTGAPTAACVDTTRLRTYPTTGICDSATGQCLYSSTVTACAPEQRCNAGQCITPPLQCNASNCAGCCDGANCIATGSQSSTRCGKGGNACGACGTSAPTCAAGVCQSACAGVTCTTPPAASCVNSTTVQRFSSTGTCIAADGGCQYAPSQQLCPSMQTCDAGSCVPTGGLDAGPVDGGLVISFSPGYDHTCAVRADQSLWCWGYNGTAQHGVTPSPGSQTPWKTPYTGMRKVWSGEQYTCVVSAQGTPSCWGLNDYGQAGNIDGGSTLAGTSEANLSWVTLAPGAVATCGLTSASNLWCWGSNDNGQLGNISIVGISTAVKVPGTGWVEVDLGARHACAIKNDHTLWCWGDNPSGELGLGFKSFDERTPQQVAGNDWSTVSLGNEFTCAIKTNGTLWCWGSSYAGELGNDFQNVDQLLPRQVAGTGWKSVRAGYRHACALDSSNGLWCWGSNLFGQLGTGALCPDHCSQPTAVAGNDWATMEMGDSTTCAQRLDGSLWCWGINSGGKIGDGTMDNRDVPTRVQGL